jgi:hypothetical protein
MQNVTIMPLTDAHLDYVIIVVAFISLYLVMSFRVCNVFGVTARIAGIPNIHRAMTVYDAIYAVIAKVK